MFESPTIMHKGTSCVKLDISGERHYADCNSVFIHNLLEEGCQYSDERKLKFEENNGIKEEKQNVVLRGWHLWVKHFNFAGT